MPTPYAFDERSVEKLRKLVQSNQLEIANLRRSLQHVAVRGHRDSWKPETVVVRKGKLDGTLNFEGEVTVSIWEWNESAEEEQDTGENVQAFDWLLLEDQSIPSGTKVFLRKIGDYYYVDGASCEEA